MKGHWRRLAAAAGEAMATTNPVPSPCSSVCRLAADAVCVGCLRTLDEIQLWATANDGQKRQVWQRIAQRVETRLAGHGAASELP